VTTIKMPTRINISQLEPEVHFLQACELGDITDMQAQLNADVNVMIEDDKGEMCVHKLARVGNIEAFRILLDYIIGKHSSSAATLVLNWQDKQARPHHPCERPPSHPHLLERAASAARQRAAASARPGDVPSQRLTRAPCPPAGQVCDLLGGRVRPRRADQPAPRARRVLPPSPLCSTLPKHRSRCFATIAQRASS
jgi:hypothetical protein